LKRERGTKLQNSNTTHNLVINEGMEAENDALITPELLVDALSGHEDGLLSIAEKLMTHYSAGYDAMGEAIIDAFADVQKLFQHVVEAAHMEGAAVERERGEAEWRKRLLESGAVSEDDVERLLYGQHSGARTGEGEGDFGIDEDRHNGTKSGEGNVNTTTPQDHRHEELIDQDVRDVLIEAIKKGQPYRDAYRFGECQQLYENACASASALLPVDSDHRGRLQLAVARAESMSADRSCAILKYAMDDVLRSGLTLSQGKYSQMDIKERSDCVLSRPNPLKSSPSSKAYDNSSSRDWGDATFGSSFDGHTAGMTDTSNSYVEQSAEEALNSLVEEMKEILAAPVYNTSPLQTVSEKFWTALGEAKRSSSRKEDRLEQSLAKIKADFLLAREDWEFQLSQERIKTDEIKRKFNELRLQQQSHQQLQERDASHANGLDTPSRSGLVDGNATIPGNKNTAYHFHGMDGSTFDMASLRNRKANSSGQSVVSIGSEFAQKAKSLVHLLNCQGKEGHDDFRNDSLDL
jgi:hypothetical protein